MAFKFSICLTSVGAEKSCTVFFQCCYRHCYLQHLWAAATLGLVPNHCCFSFWCHTNLIFLIALRSEYYRTPHNFILVVVDVVIAVVVVLLLFTQICFRQTLCSWIVQYHCTVSRTHVKKPFTLVLQTQLSTLLLFLLFLPLQFVLFTFSHYLGLVGALST